VWGAGVLQVFVGARVSGGKKGRGDGVNFIHSILRANAAVAADGDEVVDLPVNPLSVILLHLSPLNETSTITAYTWLKGLLSALDSIRVSHKGSAIIDLNGYDLAVLNLLYHRIGLFQAGADSVDDDRR